MQKIFVLAFFACLFYLPAKAVHIAGGELFYEYIGPGTSANTDSYKISMRLFRECTSTGAQLNGEVVNIGIYNNNNLTLFTTITLAQEFVSTPPTIQNTKGANPCLTGNPVVCYQLGTYSATVTLPRTSNGYLLSWIRLSRTVLQNVSGSSVGATFTTQIPGTNQLPTGSNNSPQFVIKDTSIVCKNSVFSLDFSAKDKDGDSLVYRFANAYDAGAGDANQLPNPPPPAVLNLPSVPYIPPYSGAFPLGSGVTIDSKTGIISGTSPAPGKYVVCVFVEEYRNGVLINNHQKDFILNVNDCSLTAAKLDPVYINCTSFVVNFSNNSTATNITSYLWDFGDPKSATDFSTSPTPTYTYSDTGTYTAKLKVVASGGCQDSATTQVKVYPGFIPKFKVDGTCINNPYQFTDLTTTGNNGNISKWDWDFGETTVTTDVSSAQNPTFTYPTIGTKQIILKVTSSKGCVGSDTLSFLVADKPPIKLPFKDTLICSIDALQLNVTAPGTITWSPNQNISNVNIANPIVTPKDTITYVVTVNNGGCVNKDSIKVNVLDYVSVFAGLDTSICKTDPVTLNTVSDALSYQWTDASNNTIISTLKRPTFTPLTNTSYIVKANLGKCEAKDTVQVLVFDYPQAKVSADTTICFGRSVQINGSIVGTNFSWQPSTNIINANTLNPTVSPTITTPYILSAFNTTGCKKLVSDTVLVSVIPPVQLAAGNDTAVVVNQPLQLNATSSLDGGSPAPTYLWTSVSFPMWLNNNNIPNPIAIYPPGSGNIIYQIKVTDKNGCFATSQLKVTVYNTGAEIFVPTGFTPNNDGINNILKPFPVGLRKFEFFSVYNRYGQLLYTTTDPTKGWDGTYSGQNQPAGTYVFTTQGIDYLGNTLVRKGTVVLLR